MCMYTATSVFSAESLLSSETFSIGNMLMEAKPYWLTLIGSRSQNKALQLMRDNMYVTECVQLRK